MWNYINWKQHVLMVIYGGTRWVKGAAKGQDKKKKSLVTHTDCVKREQKWSCVICATPHIQHLLLSNLLKPRRTYESIALFSSPHTKSWRHLSLVKNLSTTHLL